MAGVGRGSRGAGGGGGAGDGGGGAGDGGGSAGDESRVVDERPAAQETSLLDEDEDCFKSRASVHLYRGGPFSTGPLLEPVLKGL